MRLTDVQLVKAYRSMCTIREFVDRVHKKFTTEQIRGIVPPYARAHRGHGHSIEEGAEP
jgi:TPP-dependent pyruvate/acetoin dehydrogenase alpha subunit